MPGRALGYARVSSAEQALGTSLGDQQAVITAEATRRGVTSVKFYVEAESSLREKAEKREQMTALMGEVRTGDLVLCDKVDRWSRDPAFTYASVNKILDMGASFYAVGDACDPSTSEGDTMLNFRVLFAREEHKRIKQRLVGTRKSLRNAGYFAEGLTPFGYTRVDVKGAERNVLQIDPKRAGTVRKIFTLAIGGMSIANIGAEVGFLKSRVDGILCTRAYTGWMRNAAGDWIKGKHGSIIDVSTYAAARAALAARRHGGARPRDGSSSTDSWMLRDVARCAHCSSTMRSAYGRADETPRRFYYRCGSRCTPSYIAVRAVEEKVAPMVEARLVELKHELARGPVTAARPVLDTATARSKLASKRERYLEQHAEGIIGTPVLRGKLAVIDAEVLKLDALEQTARKPSPLEDAAVRRATLATVGTVEKLWSRADGVRRRAIVGQLCSAVRIAAPDLAVPVWRSVEELAVSVR